VGYTRLCLESVLRHTRPPYELILIDNGSTDGTADYLEELRSRPGAERVEVVRNESNAGYPAGCNQGLARARGSYLVFLNNDTVVTEGWLEGLVRWALHDWPKVGLVGAVTNYSRPPQQVAADYADLAGLPDFARRRRREFAGQALRVERLSGFCLLARREVLEKVGGYDERFGLGFFDDDDLSVRVLRAGFHLLVAQDVFIHHFGSRTFASLGIDCPRQLEENLRLLRDKWGEREAAGYRLPGQAVPQPQADPPVVVNAGGSNGRPRVSLCLIVKDEEANLPACLGCAADLADEVVVVDTGSTDGTKEVALRHGAKVFDFAWVDSFSAARNECLRQATGAYIFWLDADDRLDEDNRARLRRLFAGLGGENEAYSMKCHCLPEPGSNTATVVDHIRLFRNLPQVRWKYRVHEQILPAVRAAGAEVRWSEVVIHHTGYQDAALRRRKLQRDLRLLEMEQAEQPDDPFTLFNLGSVNQELGRHEQALPLLQKSLDLSHARDSIVRKLYSLIAGCQARLGRHEQALATLARGRAVCPDDEELPFHEALLREQQGDFEGAKCCLLGLLGGEPGRHFASVADGLRGYRGRHQLAVLCLRQGEQEQAEALWRAVLAERPDFLPALVGLGQLALAGQRWPQVEEFADRLEGLPQGELEALLLRSRGRLARREFAAARALAEEAVGRFAAAVPALVLLSHVLLQEGQDPDAAERALRAILERDPDNAEARHNLKVLHTRREPCSAAATVATS
jgi:GT2 family glycosyltransferase/tetratricopeptide (TPR) repeat protein